MKSKPIPVSRLADYAADPAGYKQRRGKVRNAAAARAGVRHHDQLGRSPFAIRWLVLVAVLVAVVIMVARLANV